MCVRGMNPKTHAGRRNPDSSAMPAHGYLPFPPVTSEACALGAHRSSSQRSWGGYSDAGAPPVSTAYSPVNLKSQEHGRLFRRLRSSSPWFPVPRPDPSSQPTQEDQHHARGDSGDSEVPYTLIGSPPLGNEHNYRTDRSKDCSTNHSPILSENFTRSPGHSSL